MEAKDKAKELVNELIHYSSTNQKPSLENAKESALIAVDEIIKAIPCREDYGCDGWVLIENTEYWREVKQEIEKL